MQSNRKKNVERHIVRHHPGKELAISTGRFLLKLSHLQKLDRSLAKTSLSVGQKKKRPSRRVDSIDQPQQKKPKLDRKQRLMPNVSQIPDVPMAPDRAQAQLNAPLNQMLTDSTQTDGNSSTHMHTDLMRPPSISTSINPVNGTAG